MSDPYSHPQWQSATYPSQGRLQLEQEYDGQELNVDPRSQSTAFIQRNAPQSTANYPTNFTTSNLSSNSSLESYQPTGPIHPHHVKQPSNSSSAYQNPSLFTSTDPRTGATQFPPTYYQPPGFNQQQEHYQQNPLNFQGAIAPSVINDQANVDPAVSPSYFTTSPGAYSSGSYANEDSSGMSQGISPPRGQDSRSPQFRQQQRVPSTSEQQTSVFRAQAPQTKRQRPEADVKEDDQDDDENKSKPMGACARCKTLKVKCEFRTDTDPCRRCLNGGHECVIPGRKKRRTPPKREHLLNQIREQAAEISRLMSQLEKVQAQAASPRYVNDNASATSPGTVPSPALSPTSTHTPALSYFGGQSSNSMNVDESEGADRDSKKAVEDWLAKAKESLSQFDGIIGGMGGMGMQKKYLVQQGDGSSNEDGSDDGFFTGEEDVYVDQEQDEYAMDNSDLENDGGRRIKKRPSRLPQVAVSPASASNAGQAKRNAVVSANKPVTLPSEASAFGLMANLSLRIKGESGASDEDPEKVGVANDQFFRLSPAPESEATKSLNSAQVQLPHILMRRIISIEQAEKLFTIYYEHMNASLSLLDPVLYTAQKTCYRSPFLFTVICAIASRYFKEQPDLYPQVMHYAQLAAGTALISGTKNVELCQGYLLLSMYPVPARRWDEDRSWLYLGLAIRVATDLNLQQPNTAKPINEAHAREMLNRTRVWLNCFNLDRSTGSQHGKTPIIRNTDYMACHSEDWWRSSPYNMLDFDVHLCAYNAELKIMADFVAKVYSNPKHPTGLNKEVDLGQLAMETDDALVALGDKWFPIASSSGTNQAKFRTSLLTLAYSYARLVALSYGFQYSFGKYKSDENPFLLRCLRAASDVVRSYVNNVAIPSQYNYILHGPEAQSVFVTFASAFLVKLLQPKFACYFTKEQRIEIRGLVRQVIEALSSPEIVIDDRHAPKLYALFLKGLLETPMARVDSQSPPDLRQTSNLPRSHPPKRPHQLQSKGSLNFRTHSSQDSRGSPASLSPSGTTSSFSDVGSPNLQHQQQFASFGSVGSSQQDPNTSNTMNFASQDFSDFNFEPPIPFENEMILQSMHNMNDAAVWQEFSALPGLSWMSHFTNDAPSSLIFDTNNQQSIPIKF